MASIGLFGEHIVKSVVHKVKKNLCSDSFTRGKYADVRLIYIISQVVLEG